MPPRKKSVKKRPATKTPDPFCVILTGKPGIGKTSLAAQFPNPFFIYDDKDRGIERLVRRGILSLPEDKLVKVSTMDDLERKLSMIISQGRSLCDTLVVESMTGIEKLGFEQYAADHFDSDMSRFYDYSKGPKAYAKSDWPDLLGMLDAVVDSGVSVLFTAHTKVKRFNNPEGEDYDRWVAKCDSEVWDITYGWAEAVLFYNYHILVKKKGISNKAQDDVIRHIYTSWTPAWDAKNQMGLPECIECGETPEETYQELRKHLSKS